MADETVVELSSLSFGENADASTFPTTRVAPKGTIEFELVDFIATKTAPKTDEASIAKGNFGGKLVIEVVSKVSAPESYKGIFHRHKYFIGSNEDPMALKESTWKANATALMKLFKDAKVALKGVTPQEAMLAAKGALYGAEVTGKKESFHPKDEPSKTVEVEKHVIKSTFPAGQRPYKVLEDHGLSNGLTTMPQQAPEGVSTSD